MNQDRIARISGWVGHWRGEDETGEEVGTGSCWPVGEDLVVTNYHVVTMGPKATVTINRYGRFPVLGVVAMDKPRDLALAKLRMGSKALCALSYTEACPAQGADVYVFGNPKGLQNTVTRGIIGAVRRSEELAQFGYMNGRPGDLLLQLDAAINPGSSGGPIVDRRGAVVGVTALSILQSQGLNFGIPCEYVAELLDMRGDITPLSRLVSSPPAPPMSSHCSVPPRQDVRQQDQIKLMNLVTYLTLAICAVSHQSETATATGAALDAEVTRLVDAGWNDQVVEHALLAAGSMIETRGVQGAAQECVLFLKNHMDVGGRREIASSIARVATADGQVDEAEAFLWRLMAHVWDDIPELAARA